MLQQRSVLILIQVARKHLNLNLTVILTVIPMESPIKNLMVIPIKNLMINPIQMISLINVQMINLIRMMIHLIKIKEKKIKKMIRKKNQKAYFVIFFQTF
ncbi:Uncharacterised protein [Neisseria subflava]|nr:Uncharacterised protein [Neisseria subflava]